MATLPASRYELALIHPVFDYTKSYRACVCVCVPARLGPGVPPFGVCAGRLASAT